MDKIMELLSKTGIPFAYDHFAEGESPDPPFICFLLPASDNFSADGQVYFKVTEVHIELYTDRKDLELEERVEAVLDEGGFFYDKTRSGSPRRSSMKSCFHSKWRFKHG